MKYFLVTPFIFFVSILPLFAQQIENVEEAFLNARDLAFDGEYENAQSISSSILETSPYYHDVRILKARIHSWQGFYSEAKTELLAVLEHTPRHKEALTTLIDVELWDNNYSGAVHTAETASRYYSADEELLLKLARAYHMNGQIDEAINVLDQINPANPDASDLREILQLENQNYAFFASYTYDHFSDVYDSWHSGYFQLSRSTSVGTLITRINAANRFDETGFQPEVDFYPEFGDGWYGYLNIGYSPSDIYPKFRYGGELYVSIPLNLEISAGARHLRYTHNNITFLTGSLTGYFGNWMLTARPYFTPSDLGVSRSYNLFLRRYLADTDNYITLRGGFGFSPEERTFQTGLDEIFLAESRFIGIEAQKSFTDSVLGFIIFDFSRQEFLFNPDNFYNRFSIQTRIEYRF